MRIKIVLFFTAVAFLSSPQIFAGKDSKAFREAMSLYESGMYDKARDCFEALGKSMTYEGYATLCAGKLNTPDYPLLMDAYLKAYPASSLASWLHYQYGLNLFDRHDYENASSQFAMVKQKHLGDSEQSQYIFKSGFCHFSLNRYQQAKKRFLELEKLPVCQYSSPARFAMGFMNYTEKNFSEAIDWFSKCLNDPRFSELAGFYTVDCRFMQKDYLYVIYKGVEIFNKIPAERQAHLARTISESYLVLGDKDKAREYYEKGAAVQDGMKDSDYFYAGSVMYAVSDFAGAIDNFTKIQNHADSLWQIASYQLGNSYIQTRNKVAALDAFKAASELDFDSDIREDASFNHAKLAFDLNNDGSWFENYLKTYSTSRKGEQIYGYMAIARLANRDYVGAIEAYDKIANPSPEQDRNYLKANYLRANQLVSAGAFSDAVPYLNSATLGLNANDPFCQLSRFWLGECQYRLGNFKEAYGIFSNLYNLSALDSKPEGNILAYNIAYSAFKMGDFDSAAKWFDRSIPYLDAGLRKDARNRRGDCDIARKDYASAVESYRKSTELNSSATDIYPYYQMALAYGLMGKKAAKVEILSKVSDLPSDTPLYSEAMYELGKTYLDMSKNDKAIGIFETLESKAQTRIDVAKALLGMGMAYANMKKTDSALSCYKKVVSDFPGSEYSQDALLAIESVYSGKGTPEKYVEYLESSGLSSGKTDSEKEKLYFGAGEQNYLSGNFEQAKASFHKYIETFPQGEFLGRAWYFLGESCRSLGDRLNACENFKKACQLAGEGTYLEMSLLGYAQMNFELERFEEAYKAFCDLREKASFDERRTLAVNGMMQSAYRARLYEEAISAAKLLNNSNVETEYILGKSLLSVSRRSEALEVFEKLAADSPSTPQGAEANVILIQDCFDRGEFDRIADMVYAFSPKAGDQNYFLARAFLILGDSFVELGNLNQAIATYESIRDGYSSDDTSDDILALTAEKLAKANSLKNQL